MATDAGTPTGTSSVSGAAVAAVGVSPMAAAAGGGETALFIYPGYAFARVGALLTNFHLPQSTLLMLVSAFAGTGLTRAAYAEAVRERYRFYRDRGYPLHYHEIKL